MLDKLIAVGERCGAAVFISCGTAARTAPLQARPASERRPLRVRHLRLNNLIAPMEKAKSTTDKSAEAPRYTGDELRRAV